MRKIGTQIFTLVKPEGGRRLSGCTQPSTRCQTENIKHKPKPNVYCGVLQCRKALQPCMLVRVGVGIVLCGMGPIHIATLQY